MGEVRLREQLRDHDEWPSQAPGADTAVRVDAEDLRGALAALDAARAEIERLKTAAADERADVVAYMDQVATKLREKRPRSDYLDAQADTYERASEAIADECHVGAAKVANHG
jgi:hypothetical protein